MEQEHIPQAPHIPTTGVKQVAGLNDFMLLMAEIAMKKLNRYQFDVARDIQYVVNRMNEQRADTENLSRAMFSDTYLYFIRPTGTWIVPYCVINDNLCNDKFTHYFENSSECLLMTFVWNYDYCRRDFLTIEEVVWK